MSSRLVLIERPAGESSPVIEESCTRLVAELRAAGFEVELDSSDSLRSARSEQERPVYRAKLRLLLEGDELTVEITSDAPGASSTIAITGRKQELAAVALQSAEFLRAGLVPRLSPAAREPAQDASAKARKDAGDAPRVDRWLLGLSGGFMSNWGASDRLPVLDIAPGVALSPYLSVGAHVFVPLSDARFESQAGDAEYRTWLALATVQLQLLRWAALELEAGVSAGVARSLATGRPEQPFEALDSALWSAALGANLSADYQLLEDLALSTQLHVLTLSPNPVIAVREYERRLGRPSVLASLGARVSF